jgi:hypothetical protein
MVVGEVGEVDSAVTRFGQVMGVDMGKGSGMVVVVNGSVIFCTFFKIAKLFMLQMFCFDVGSVLVKKKMCSMEISE